MKRTIAAVLTVILLLISVPFVSTASNFDSYLEDKIYRGLYEYDNRISVREDGVSISEVYNVYRHVLQNYPELYYAGFSFVYMTDSKGFVTSIEPSYELSYNAMMAERNAYLKQINDIKAMMEPGWSDLEKCLFVHDYLVTLAEYDADPTKNNVYTLLCEGKGLCQAYTAAYTCILRMLNIQATAVISEAMNHTWNLVKVNGSWYHVDVTWDDPLPDRLGQAQHEHFLMSDQEAQNTGHYAWNMLPGEANIRCTDTQYDQYFWENTTSAFQHYDGDWYYIAPSSTGRFTIYKTDLGETQVPVASLNAEWPVIGEESYYWIGAFTGTAAVGDWLYFNTPDAILSYHFVTGTVVTRYKPDTSEGYLYGISRSGDKLFYVAAQDPYMTGKQIDSIPFPAAYLPGDVNGDGRVNGKDSVLLLQYLAGWDVAVDPKAADVSGDGRVNGKDSVLLLQYLAGWDVVLS